MNRIVELVEIVGIFGSIRWIVGSQDFGILDNFGIPGKSRFWYVEGF